MVTITASNPTATSIEVSWQGVPEQNTSGATYLYVRVDEYPAAIFNAVKQGQPLPKADRTQGAPDPSSGSTLSSADGTQTVFSPLLPSTSYVFVLYAYADLASGGAPQPEALAFSGAISTLSKPAPGPENNTPTYPVLSTQPFAQTLQNQNHVVVDCANASTFDHWNISVNAVQEPQDLSGDDTYTIWSQPNERFVINAIGKIHNADYSPWGPNIPIAAGQNVNYVRAFLNNSGVDGSNGVRTFVVASKSTSIRNMLGL